MGFLLVPPRQELQLYYAIYRCSSRFKKDLELIFHSFPKPKRRSVSMINAGHLIKGKHDALTLITLLLALSSSIILQPKNNFCLQNFFLEFEISLAGISASPFPNIR